MSKFIDLDQERLSRVKNIMFKEVMDKAFKTNVSKHFSGSCLLDLVGGSMESMKEKLNAIENPTQMQGIIKAVITTIDDKVDSYASKKGYRLYAMEAEETDTEEQDDQTVFDDADTEIQKGEDTISTDSFDSANGSTDALADTVKELFEDLAQKQADEIRNLSKTVLKLEKIKQDEELKNRKAEDGEFIDETDEGEGEDKGSEENKDGNGESGGNPFEEGSQDTEGDDPFGGTDDGSEGGSSEEGGNPFDSNGEGSDEGEGNPFDEGGDEGGSTEEESNPFDDSQDGDGEASFESLIDYPDLKTTILGSQHKYKPFDGLTKGDIKNYAKFISNEIMGEKLASAYASESINELNNGLDKYKKLTGNIIKMMSDTLAVSAIIGLPIDKDRIRYPYL